MHDLVVEGGTVVDGTGVPARTADIAVSDGRITDVGTLSGQAARQRVDADGLLVTPGWVEFVVQTPLAENGRSNTITK